MMKHADEPRSGRRGVLKAIVFWLLSLPVLGLKTSGLARSPHIRIRPLRRDDLYRRHDLAG